MTLSKEQKALAEERVAEAGLADRVRIHLVDYRKLPPSFRGVFDAVVSSEMLEVSLPSTVIVASNEIHLHGRRSG